ncbi:hypothetical protein [Amycolatopsis methanolica]|uniref:Uncharacterized protein n=1 Tax=Amycolatopsis methanolica 239 TaxID=1068978 RepID=A0A076MRN4_AMYME|nr:hypothetical protein [Amycolatopsis methanolica]AIJ21505.1 hypothetical protein AMETH_1413 [Amycolatopsis methanolica 239]
MDFLNAVPGQGGHVLVEMSPNVAECLYAIGRDLLTALETGYRGRRRLRDEDLFPDAYELIRDSKAFRERHGAAMRESLTAAVRAVVLNYRGQTVFTLDRAWLRAWFTMVAHAPALYVRKPRWTVGAWTRLPVTENEVRLFWLHYTQAALAQACAVSPCEPPVSGT